MSYADSERFSRTELLIGRDNLTKLNDTSILVFGVGGVGGYAVEALARCGIGKITVVDGDVFDVSNLNRQLASTEETVGIDKAIAVKERLFSIVPNCKITAIKAFYGADNQDIVDYSQFDLVLDAIDTVSSKLLIIKKAKAAGVPVISAMGTARKLDPTKVKLGDIFDTQGCPLARVMRRELRKMGIDSLPVVWSDEDAIMPKEPYDRDTPIGSVSFVPGTAGLFMASYVVNTLIDRDKI